MLLALRAAGCCACLRGDVTRIAPDAVRPRAHAAASERGLAHRDDVGSTGAGEKAAAPATTAAAMLRRLPGIVVAALSVFLHP